MGDVIEALEALAGKLGTDAAVLWDTAMAQVWVDVAHGVVVTLIWGSIAGLSVWLHLRLEEEKHDEEGAGEGVLAFLVVVTLLTAVPALIYGFLTLGDFVQAVVNPEWAALEHLRQLAP